jgi:hypothetical protein
MAVRVAPGWLSRAPGPAAGMSRAASAAARAGTVRKIGSWCARSPWRRSPPGRIGGPGAVVSRPLHPGGNPRLPALLVVQPLMGRPARTRRETRPGQCPHGRRGAPGVPAHRRHRRAAGRHRPPVPRNCTEPVTLGHLETTIVRAAPGPARKGISACSPPAPTSSAERPRSGSATGPPGQPGRSRAGRPARRRPCPARVGDQLPGRQPGPGSAPRRAAPAHRAHHRHRRFTRPGVPAARTLPVAGQSG